jgi:hypothetical protein
MKKGNNNNSRWMITYNILEEINSRKQKDKDRSKCPNDALWQRHYTGGPTYCVDTCAAAQRKDDCTKNFGLGSCIAYWSEDIRNI